jgi:4-hydroxy-tetrahydrodipicolinate synthase
MFSGFPLTPLTDSRVNDAAFSKRLRRTSSTGIDAIDTLGPTSSYASSELPERVCMTNLSRQRPLDGWSPLPR